MGHKHDQKTETKTVTRTVHIISPDKTTTQTKNQITFTRTADVDEVTGQTQHSGWTNGDNGTFNEVIIHAVAGYTPQSDITEDLEKNSKGQYEIKSFHVDQDSNDIVVNVTYGADAQKATITYIDDDETNSNGKQGKVINVQNLSGHTAETISTNVQTAIDNYKKAGYVLDINDAPDQLTFDNDDHATQAFTVHLGHGHITVTPDQPKEPGDNIPDTNKRFPKGVDHDSLNKTVTRTINITDPSKQTTSIKQKLTFTRTADVDEVTGDIQYSNWVNSDNGGNEDNGTFSAVTLKPIVGYTPKETTKGNDLVNNTNAIGVIEVKPVTVHHDTSDITIDITYAPDSQVAHLRFIDDDNNVTLDNSDEQTGVSDKGPISFKHAADILNGYLKQGYQFSEVTNDTDVNNHKIVSGQSFADAMRNLGNFDHLDSTDQIFTVHLKHGHVTVTPDQPKNPGDNIPDTDKHFPKGVDHDSLNKTVTRTINVTDPNDNKSQKVDQITFTRTADVDEVTGDVHYSDWTNGNNGDTGKFDEAVITSFYGYTPHANYLGKNSKGQYVINEISVSHKSNNIEINVTYTADPQVANLNFVDDEGHVDLASWDTQFGFSNAPINFSHAEEILKEYLQQGYQFVNVTNDADHKVLSDNSFEEAAKKFGDFDVLDNVDQIFTIHLKHGHVTVNPNDPKNQDDPIPGTDKHFPNGVDHDSLNKTITRTVNVTDPISKETKTTNQSVTLTRSADVDVVTENVTYGNWSTSSFNGQTVTHIKGYTSHIKLHENDHDEDVNNIPRETVDEKTPNEVFNVTYSTDPQHATITYYDDDTHQSLHVDKFDGVTNGTVQTNVQKTIDEYQKAGYVVANSDAPVDINFDNDDDTDQAFTVHLKHGHVTVNPNDLKNQDDPIPGTDKHFPNGVDHDSLNKTITRTVNVTDPISNETKTTSQSVTLTRSADVDVVTGNVTYGNWSTGSFKGQTLNPIQGYTMHIALHENNENMAADNIPDEEVKSDTPNEVFDVTYSADPQHATITYYDDDTHQSLHVDKFDGVTNETVHTNVQKTIDEYQKAGYVVANNNAPADITFDNDDDTDQTFTVHLKHNHVTVDPKNPKTPSDVIPGTDKHFPKGVEHDDLNRTITRTIIVNYPDGHHQTITQTATFTRNATVDEVTRKVTYGEWNVVSQKLSQFDAPVINGYVPNVKFVPEITVNPDSKDTTVEIYYQVDPAIERTHRQRLIDSNAIRSSTSLRDGQHYSNNDFNNAHSNAQRLPQTGNDHSEALIGLGLVGTMMSMLGLADKKRRHL